MKESNSRREFLSQSGKMVTAAALFGTSVPLAHAAVAGTLNCEANNTMKITDPHYYLDNVLREGDDFTLKARLTSRQHRLQILQIFQAGNRFDIAVAAGNGGAFRLQ